MTDATPKRKKSTSPTQRTKAALKRDGVTHQVVERWNHFAGVRQDLFGIVDIVALRAGRIVGIQVTSGSSVSARIEKSIAEPRLREWLSCGGDYEIHGWRLAWQRGKRKTYQCRVVRFWLDGEALMWSDDDGY